MNKQYSQKEKSKLINEWQSNGLSKSEFSRRNNISISTFCKWTSSYPNGKFKKEKVPTIPDFIEVQAPCGSNPTIASHIKIVITTANGTKMEMYSDKKLVK